MRSNDPQFVEAMVGALLDEGADPQAIEDAVSRVRCLRLGQMLCGPDPLNRAFCFEQARRLRPEENRVAS